MSSWLGALTGRASRATWVLMLLAVVGLAAGWGTKAPCLGSFKDSYGLYEINWTNWHQYRAACYSDTIPLYGLERLSDGGLPYKTSWVDPGDGTTRYMEYPVMTGMLQYGVMLVTKGVVHTFQSPTNPDPPEVITYFNVMALVLAIAWLVAVACTIPLAARRRDVILMALSPLVAVQVFTNFDPLAVMFACAGLLAWVRRKPGWAGVLLGLGTAAKLYPVFLLVPLLALCLRTGKLRLWRQAAGGAVAAWVVVNLAFAVLWTRGWWEFFRLNSTRPADYDTIYNAIGVFAHWSGFDGPLAGGQTPTKLNLITLGLFLLVCLGVVAVGLTAPRRPRLAALAFLVVAGFLLTNKVWSPQYSLWLVPLAVLALPRWLPLLAWMGVDAFVWYPRMGFFLGLAEPGQGNSVQAFLKVVLLRDLLVLVVCGLILRAIYRPETDPVRRAGLDDPAGGPLDGADDVPLREALRGWRRPPAVPQHAGRPEVPVSGPPEPAGQGPGGLQLECSPEG